MTIDVLVGVAHGATLTSERRAERDPLYRLSR
jgi:hypothetical protein